MIPQQQDLRISQAADLTSQGWHPVTIPLRSRLESTQPGWFPFLGVSKWWKFFHNFTDVLGNIKDLRSLKLFLDPIQLDLFAHKKERLVSQLPSFSGEMLVLGRIVSLHCFRWNWRKKSVSNFEGFRIEFGFAHPVFPLGSINPTRGSGFFFGSNHEKDPWSKPKFGQSSVWNRSQVWIYIYICNIYVYTYEYVYIYIRVCVGDKCTTTWISKRSLYDTIVSIIVSC